MNKISRNKGVTLILLAVTIILLLIISATVIAQFTGNGGIFNNAKESKKKTGIVEERTILNSSIASAIGASSKSKVEEENLRKYFNKNIGAENKEYSLDNKGNYYEVTFKNSGNVYIIFEDGKMLSRDEFSNTINIPTSLVIENGKESTIEAITGADKEKINWEVSEGKDVINIEKNNDTPQKIKVKTLKAGTSKIIAKISNEVTAECEVVVQINPQGLILNKTEVKIDMSQDTKYTRFNSNNFSRYNKCK